MSAQKKKVLIRGPILTRSGYGEQARFAYRSLKSRPDLFDVFLAPTNWGNTSWIVDDNEERKEMDRIIRDTTIHIHNCNQQGLLPFDASIQVTIPQEWERISPKNIGYTAGTETTNISHKWVEHCQNVDRIIAVSNHTKEAFENTEYEGKNKAGQQVTARCNTPIDVVSFPAKGLEIQEVDFEPSTEFNYLVVAQWSERKNMNKTIQGFLQEFQTEPVGLIIKTNLGKNCLLDRQHCMAQIKQFVDNFDSAPMKMDEERKCKIYLLHGTMTDEEIAGLYVHPKVKALVNIAHGEGFGLPMFEAAQAGLPIIAPNWGGQKDFLNAPVTTRRKGGKTKTRVRFLATKVDYNIKPIQKEAVWENILIPQSRWCFAIDKSYKLALRAVYRNYDRATSDAKKLKKHVEENFSEEGQKAKFVDSVYETLFGVSSTTRPTSVITL
jgi:glycosyltransferase involved in cell wall biosynthesis